MFFRAARSEDLNKIKHLLQSNDLPYQDCGEHIDGFVVVEDELEPTSLIQEPREIIAIGAMESHGEVGLLRSLVVADCFKSQKIGQLLCRKIIEQALLKGIKGIYLMTMNAQCYFEKQGFVRLDKDKAPMEIQMTKQFSTLCPKDAILMQYRLAK